MVFPETDEHSLEDLTRLATPSWRISC